MNSNSVTLSRKLSLEHWGALLLLQSRRGPWRPTGRPTFITCCFFQSHQGNDSKALGRESFHIRWNETSLEGNIFICVTHRVDTVWLVLWRRERLCRAADTATLSLRRRRTSETGSTAVSCCPLRQGVWIWRYPFHGRTHLCLSPAKVCF